MEMKFKTETISTDRFTYSPETKTFVTEASSLSDKTISSAILLENPKTKKKVYFEYISTRTNKWGEITSWLFRTKNHTEKLFIEILND